MKRLTRIGVVSTIAVLSAAACGKSATKGDECTTGTERCSCYKNGTCDEGLECRSDLCVEPGTSGAAGGGGEPSGGSGNVSGTESGGRGGTSGRGGSGGRGGTATGGSGDGGADTGGASGNAGEPSGGTGGDGGMGGRLVGGAGSGGTSPGGVGGMPVGGAGGMPAGAGGMPVAGMGGGGCAARVAAPSEMLIDDLEDRDNAIAPPRVGYWFTFTDQSCTSAVPPPDSTGASPFPPAPGAGQNASVGARFQGFGCVLWGAGLGFDLANCASRAQAYDATVFSGISFWYKSVSALRFMIVTADVISTMRGGNCVPGIGMGMECDNPHGADLPASAGRVVSISFNYLFQAFGQMKSFDKSQLVYVEFQVAQGQPFDFTVDNLAFVP